MTDKVAKTLQEHKQWVEKSVAGKQADLRAADLRNMNLTGVDFRYADLRGADLTGSNLTDANFRNADLRGANLTKACCLRTEFINARMEGANLEGVDLRSAVMQYADLAGANFARKAVWNQAPQEQQKPAEKERTNDQGRER